MEVDNGDNDILRRCYHPHNKDNIKHLHYNGDKGSDQTNYNIRYSSKEENLMDSNGDNYYNKDNENQDDDGDKTFGSYASAVKNSMMHGTNLSEYDVNRIAMNVDDGVSFNDENGNLPRRSLKSLVFEQGFFYYPDLYDTNSPTSPNSITLQNIPDPDKVQRNVTSPDSIKGEKLSYNSTNLYNNNPTKNGRGNSVIDLPKELTESVFLNALSRFSSPDILNNNIPFKHEPNSSNWKQSKKSASPITNSTVASCNVPTVHELNCTTTDNVMSDHEPSNSCSKLINQSTSAMTRQHDSNNRRTSVTINGKLVLFSPTGSSSHSLKSDNKVGGKSDTEISFIQPQNSHVKYVNTEIIECQQTDRNVHLNKPFDDENIVEDPMFKISIKKIKEELSIESLQTTKENVRETLVHNCVHVNKHTKKLPQKVEQQGKEKEQNIDQAEDIGNIANTESSYHSVVLDKHQHRHHHFTKGEINQIPILDDPNVIAYNPNTNKEVSEFFNGNDDGLIDCRRKKATPPPEATTSETIPAAATSATTTTTATTSATKTKLYEKQTTNNSSDCMTINNVNGNIVEDTIIYENINNSPKGGELIRAEQSQQQQNTPPHFPLLTTTATITTTPPTTTTTITDRLNYKNNFRFDLLQQESAVEEQHSIEPKNVNDISQQHYRRYSTDEDESPDISTSVINNLPVIIQSQEHQNFSHRRCASTGDLLDIVGRREEIFQKEIREEFYQKTRFVNNHRLWLSRSCSDITSYTCSREEILSSVESITAREADDEFDSENERFHDNKSDENCEKVNVESDEKKSYVKELRRRKAIRRVWRVKKRPLVPQKSICVDNVTREQSGYFSRIHDRRNGLIKSRNKIFETHNEQPRHQATATHNKQSLNLKKNDELNSRLVDLKQLHKQHKHKKGLFITRSVESLVRNTKKRKKILTGIFSLKHHQHHHSSEERMGNLRETCILDDDEEVNAINFLNGHHHPHHDSQHHHHHHHNARSPPKIEVIQVTKVSGVIELYIDKHGDVIRKIEIIKVPGQSLGFFIRFGNGIDRMDGIFISRVTLDSFVDKNNLLHTGDEILQINKVDITGHTLEQVAAIMQTTENLIIKTRSALPLPVNASPLLKSSYTNTNIWNKLHKGEKTEDSSNGSISLIGNKPSSYEDINADKTMSRTWSDPHKPCESSDNFIDNDLRERSKSQTDQHKKNQYQRSVSHQNNAPKSPVYSRKLPSIPDGKIQDFLSDELHSKGFSRAQRYQTTLSKSPTAEIEEFDLTTAPVQSSQKSPTFMISPKIFANKKDQQKKNSVGSILSVQSSDSLSSMSDSEESIKSITPEKVCVYSSDSTNHSGPTKGYTGKLNVAIYKLIGRISNLDADCYCTIEIDDEFKATTQLHRIKEVVSIDESFDIDIQHAHVVMFFIFHKQTSKRQDKLASQACIVLDHLLKEQYNSKIMLTTTNHVQMRLKINFTEAGNYLHRSPSERTKGVFGFNLSQTLVKEENTIPIIVRKCVEEIEKRGLDITGIYRISGSARKKKLLRQQFEENSLSTNVSNPDEVDCHVLAGILKDYLRELPNPLISDEMYNNIYNKATVKNKDQNNLLAELMKKLPYTNRATLIYIMDHLKRVAANHEVNKMTFQNIAVCFGPVMMATPMSGTANLSDMLDFKKQIDALEFLLSIWPTNVEHQNGI